MMHLETDEGWAKLNEHYWRRDYPGFVRFFFGELTSEPHSTKVLEDIVGWALDGSVDAMLAEGSVENPWTLEAVEAVCRDVRCPLLIVHGTNDHCQPVTRAHRLAELTGGRLVIVDGADHLIPGAPPGPREPADPRFRPFDSGGHARMSTMTTSRTWTRALSRRRRALYISSPIGLGHAHAGRRDCRRAARAPA